MNENTNWELLVKYLSGECSAPEKDEIEFWINKNEQNREMYNSTKRIWDTPEESFDASNTQTIWNNII